MNGELLFVLLLLGGAVVSFVREKVPADLTALVVFGLLAGGSALFPDSRLPALGDLFSVFANPAPLTVACMFILSAGLERTGVITLLTGFLRRTTRYGYRRFLLLLILPVALVSAFINNTPVVVILIPVLLGLSKDLGVPGSKLLLPLSYASIFGGACTLMGTSTNILGSSLLAEAGHEPLGMFSFALVAAPLALGGGLYLAVFGDRLLPRRETLGSLLPEEARTEYIAEAFVRRDSPLVGEVVQDTRILRQPGMRLVEIIRRGFPVPGELREVVLEEGDRIVLACRPSGMEKAAPLDGVLFSSEDNTALEPIAQRQASIVEAMVAPNSGAIGRTPADLNLRQRYRTLVLAIHREGKNLRSGFEETVLLPGDTLLLLGPQEALESLRSSRELVLLDRAPAPPEATRGKAWTALGTLAGVVLLATLEVTPIAVATVLGVAVLFAARVLKPADGYRAVEWKILVLIYGMLGLGMALQSSGGTTLIAAGVGHLVESVAAPAWQPLLLLVLLYLTTSVLTEFLSNNATIVLIVPIVVSLTVGLGLDPRPYTVAACIAASASFSTPIGYQTNTLVYGVGAYRFTDFARIGIPLNLFYWIGTVLLVPLVWDLRA
mgnify:FL=1